MIFYFSGTGNSKRAAKAIAAAQSEQLLPIPAELDRPEQELRYELKDGELLGLVYPVHAWGPPRLVLDFIERLAVSAQPYIFSLGTCGDEEGHSARIIKRALARKGLHLDSSFCLVMPNNYIIGFDVDPGDEAEAKLKAADEKLVKINRILAGRQSGIYELLPGSAPGLKSTLINPLFNRFALRTGSFRADDNCNGCGLCERICPVHTIKVEHKPSWGKACTQCLACIHHCPVKAIQYGKGTAGKGRYVCPE